MNYPVHIVAVGGLIQILNIINEEFMRDKVRYMLNSDGNVAYVVFSRNPYVLHEVQYL